MSNEAMFSKASSGNTALHVAALAGNKEAAKLLVNKNPDLLYDLNEDDMLPIHLAARNSHKPTLMYLISVCKKDVENSPFVGKLGALLLTIAIASEFIDVALYLVQKYPDLAKLSDNDDDYALQVIAGTKSVFPSGQSLNWWQNWIYSSIPLTSSTMTKITNDIENQSSHDQMPKKFDWFKIITFVVGEAKSIRKKKIMHQQTLELVKRLCTALESLPSSDASPVYQNAIIKAAQNGIHEVVEVIVEMFPNAIYAQEPETDCNIFHIAARERVENIFNLIYHMNERKQYFYDSTDSSSNNFMHMCGELAPPHKLNLISGAALQLQRELQWFKEMEMFVNPSRRTWYNSDDKTPQMVFSEKHEKLKSQGEQWMKDTANSCSIAAALIVTVVFAAAFTVPGGVHSETGVPVYVEKTSFIIFAITDSISMFTSATSLLMFLSILTSRYAEQDFLYVLPKRLCIGLLTLFTSITFMIVAFSAAMYITLKEKSNLFLIPVALLACLPVSSFVLLQFPLLIAVMYTTYGPGIFGKKSDRRLY
ncbi:ankyrin repeat-containing protein-like [Dorcoceras hygrometricum]|uniref:Ankyrin repeat-containing protein-like n=1 Tax=Dorcoceras hygrometricum TaxID=472368 RepID=A0A2Z6ZYS9_9LAMI|nr:ankyrin repeat-containing protein-like [Dorcoceras hygrometricum]